MPDLQPSDIDDGFAPARSPSAYTVELDGEAVLYDEATDRLHLLNHTATLLWTLFDGHTALAMLARELSAELLARYDTVVTDLIAITRHLGDEGLLQGVAPDPTDEAEAIT